MKGDFARSDSTTETAFVNEKLDLNDPYESES